MQIQPFSDEHLADAADLLNITALGLQKTFFPPATPHSRTRKCPGFLVGVRSET